MHFVRFKSRNIADTISIQMQLKKGAYPKIGTLSDYDPLSIRSISLQLAEGCVGVAGEFCNGAASDVFSIPEYLNFPIVKQDF